MYSYLVEILNILFYVNAVVESCVLNSEIFLYVKCKSIE